MTLLVCGGAASGKSAFAEERLLGQPGPHYYIATMRPSGEEGLTRIERHRELRAGKGFETIECEADVAGIDIPAEASALLEDIGNLLANEMFDEDGAMRDVAAKIVDDVLSLAARVQNLVIVTNEAGGGAEPHDAGTRAYVEAMGSINVRLAAAADEAYEVVVGIPIALKRGDA